MATILESPFLSSRLRQIEEHYEEPSTFGRCDCISYSYLVLSVILFTIGTVITIIAMNDVVEKSVFYQLGHMWLMGPILICSGFMVAIKCMLYLRHKSVVQMIFRQRQLFRQLQEISGNQGIGSTNTGSSSGPPPYDMITQNEGPSDVPPPSYAEAVALLRQSKIQDTKSCDTVDTGETAETKP